jgi:tetratricopeptide (TPR) repeat protein
VSRENLADVLCNLGRGAEAEREYHAALEELQSLTDAYPNVPHYRFSLALTHHALANLLLGGRPAEAESEYRAALKEHQRLVDEHANVADYRHWLATCHQRLGTSLAKLGKRADDEREYRIALQQHQAVVDEHPDVTPYRDFLANTHDSLGDLLAGLGKWADAEAEYRAALREYQRLAEKEARYRFAPAASHARLGKALNEQGRYEEATAEYREAPATLREAVRLSPGDARLHNNLAWFLATYPDPKVRDSGQSLTHAKKAVELAPDEASCWNTLGVAHYRAGDWKAAVKALTKSEELSPGRYLAVNAYFLAMAHWQLGETGQAQEWYAKAVARMGQHEGFRAEAAELLGIPNTPPAPEKPPTKP